MLGNLTGWHLIAILLVILLLFGATRLPALSKGLAQSMRIFKQETRGLKDDEAQASGATVPYAQTGTPAAPPVAAEPVRAEPVRSDPTDPKP